MGSFSKDFDSDDRTCYQLLSFRKRRRMLNSEALLVYVFQRYINQDSSFLVSGKL